MDTWIVLWEVEDGTFSTPGGCGRNIETKGEPNISLEKEIQRRKCSEKISDLYTKCIVDHELQKVEQKGKVNSDKGGFRRNPAVILDPFLLHFHHSITTTFPSNFSNIF